MRSRPTATGGARPPRRLASLLARGVMLTLAAIGTGRADAAQAQPARGTRTAAAPRVLTIEAFDFAFRAPATVPAGLTTIRLVNRGKSLHHVQLNRLSDGRDVPEMLRDFRGGAPLPRYMTGDGGPTAALGGQTLEGQVVLRPGRYAIICWVPAPDGALHLHKGMYGRLEVTGSAATAALPASDVTITMMDYGYLVPAIARGRRVVRVVNRGPQAHELLMVRLAQGRTARDAAEWAERGQTGPVPGAMVGGVAALSVGAEGQFSADFTPGRYALICFVPDQKDGKGKPHVAYGMMREFTVP